MIAMQICARCGCWINDREATGESAIYNPNGPDIILHEKCFFDEDEEIEREGMNDLPDRLVQYKRTLKENGY